MNAKRVQEVRAGHCVKSCGLSGGQLTVALYLWILEAFGD